MHWIVILVGSVLIVGLLGAAICLTIETSAHRTARSALADYVNGGG
jgi:hypothetical protein